MLLRLLLVVGAALAQTDGRTQRFVLPTTLVVTNQSRIQLIVTPNGRTIACQRSSKSTSAGQWYGLWGTVLQTRTKRFILNPPHCFSPFRYGDCDGDARDANFITLADANGQERVFGSIQVGSEQCQISPRSGTTSEIACTAAATKFAMSSSMSPDGRSATKNVTRNLLFGYTESSTGQTLRSSAGSSSRRLYDDRGSNVDILVVWTAAAECGTSNLAYPCTLTPATRFLMMGAIKLVIAQTNTAFAESGIATQLRLVHAYRDSVYVETTYTKYTQELGDLRLPNDGKLDMVHMKRALYGADMVAMIAGTLKGTRRHRTDRMLDSSLTANSVPQVVVHTNAVWRMRAAAVITCIQ
jgi:hypothetical protein